MKILLFGSGGQIGWELSRSLAPIGELKACSRCDVNMENLEELEFFIRQYNPNVIVNAAAYTNVDKAEEEQDKVYRINAESVGLLARVAKKIGAILVHYSTDYVFDGNKEGLYLETDATNPQSVYGKSKLQSEILIKNSKCNYLIFRVSWIYSNRRKNFPLSIFQLAKENDDLKIVCDQIGTPTSARFVSDVTALCLHQIVYKKISINDVGGVYHLAPSGSTSWYEYARYIINKALECGADFRLIPENIFPICTSEYRTTVIRPANSRFDTKKIQNTFGVYLPNWKEHVDKLVEELYS